MSELPPTWTMLDVDTLYIPMIVAVLADRGVSLVDAYGTPLLRSLRDAQYAGLLAQAEQILTQANRRVVLVGSFSTELADPGFRERCEARFRCPVAIVETWAPPAVVRKRIDGRSEFWDQMRRVHWDRERTGYAEELPLRPWPVIDTRAETDARSVLQYLLDAAQPAPLA